MANPELEKHRVEHLLQRLGLPWSALINPNANGLETGVDIVAKLSDGRSIGVQVTEIDPHTTPGKARAQERQANAKGIYFGWAQNDLDIYMGSFARTVARKTAIMEKHSSNAFNEVWLLVCSGAPEAPVSTFVATGCLHESLLDTATSELLKNSKYNHCYFYPLLGTENAFYKWERGSTWEKSVTLDEFQELPRGPYTKNLMQAAAANDWEEVDRLCDEEVGQTLHDLRVGRPY